MSKRSRKILQLALRNTKTKDGTERPLETQSFSEGNNVPSKKVKITPPAIPREEKNENEINACLDSDIRRINTKDWVMSNCYADLSSGALRISQNNNVPSKKVNIISNIVTNPPVVPGEEKNENEINVCLDSDIRRINVEDCVVSNFDVDTSSDETLRLFQNNNGPSKKVNIVSDIVITPPAIPREEKNENEINICSDSDIRRIYGEDCVVLNYDADTNSTEIISSSGTSSAEKHHSINNLEELSDMFYSDITRISAIGTKGYLHKSSSSKTTSLKSCSSNGSFDDPNYSPSDNEHQDSESESDSVIPVVSPISTSFHKESSNLQMEIPALKGTYKLEKDAEIDNENKLEVLLENEVQVEQARKKNYKDKQDLCMFCEKDVSHFARHIFTWHAAEVDVQRILSLAPNSKKRREALSALRKRGNFIRNRANTTLRPIKRVSATSKPPAEEYLPCSHCFGFYKKRFLYRHTKRCSENCEINKDKRQTSQNDGHTTLLMGTLLKHDELLKKELFPRMRADEINMVVKKDFLICNYGYSYLKGRKSKGNLDLVRQDMRRLAKLLKFARIKDESIKELIDVLRPCHFKLIIEGVGELSHYNSAEDTYESPTLAMNFGTLLKKCCELAYIHLLQKSNTNDQRKGVKILKTLIESQWANEISAQAATNLKEKQWNKTELIPLTADLKKLNDFLQAMSHEKYIQLKLNANDESSYNILKEVLYCQIILLNRRRPGEVAQLKVHTYQSVNLDVQPESEFQNCLTETEKILSNSYSRIVIRGKRGRGVPVLLSLTMRKHFDYLMEVRNNFATNNDYVFHTAGSSFVDGTKLLYKYVQKCGIDNPRSISATKLRKHLATVTQLLNFSRKDLEQLSNFMGHTLNTHCNFYRMPDNLYQTAKVSKLLMLMSQGGAEQFRGMQLDDIDIDLEPLQNDEQPFDELLSQKDALHPELKNISENQNSKVNSSSEIGQKDFKVQRKAKQTVSQRQRVTWSDNHKKIIATYFAEHIQDKQAFKRHEVNQLIDTYPQIFKGKMWTSIKAVVYNIYTGKLKVPA